MDTLDQSITAKLDTMTRAQQALARYLLDHREQVAFMTARQLADAAGQSDAAVVRFARAAGYSGYTELRAALREGLLERAGAVGMHKSSPSSTETLRAEIFDTHAALMAKTATMNTDETGVAVADMLIAARRIWVTAHGTSYPLAAYIAMHLNQVLDNVQVFNVEHGDLADRLRSIDQADVFIGIGYARYLPYTVDILKAARNAKAKIIAITDRPTSPLARLASHSLYPARDMTAFAWWSQAGTLALADWITSLVMVRAPERVASQLRRSDAAWKQLGHWGGSTDPDPSLEQHLITGMGSRRKRAPTPGKS